MGGDIALIEAQEGEEETFHEFCLRAATVYLPLQRTGAAQKGEYISLQFRKGDIQNLRPRNEDEVAIGA